MSKLDYLAGLLDGEGCLAITSQNGTYSATVTIVNTEKVLMRWLKKNFNGRISVSRYAKGNRRTCYRWVVDKQKDIVELLNKVKSRLVIKKEQANCILKLRSLVTIYKVRPGCVPKNRIKKTLIFKQKARLLKEKCSNLKHREIV